MSIAVLVILLACAAGCSTTSSTPTATTPAATASGAPGATSTAPAAGTAAPATASATTSGIDTTVSVHANDYACLDIQKALGVEYLYPDEKYKVWVTTPGSGPITPNLLVVDATDNMKFSSAKPVWDSVQKTWSYDGIVPLVKIIDVTSPQTKTLTIKNQGKYYLCIDDRKEVGVNDAVYLVPVKVTKA